MSGYIGNIPVPQATQTRQTFTATASQTTFNTAGYSPGYIDVFLNGVKLAPADYTATNGSDVVLAVGAASGDILETVAYEIFQVLDQDFTGDFTVDGTTFVVDSTNNRVGVGTASPARKFEVHGTSSESNRLISVEHTGADYAFISFSDQNTTDDGSVRVGGLGNDLIAFAGNSERMRIDSSGNVGIGTSSPSHLIDGRLSGTSSGEVISVGNVTNGSFGGIAISDGGTYPVRHWGTSLEFYTGNSTYSSATERMRIDSSGRVMIGTTTEGHADGDNFTIAGSGNTGMTIRSTNAQKSTIYFSDSTSGSGEYAGYIHYDHSGDNLNIGVNGNERMRIDSIGEVYIGHTGGTAPWAMSGSQYGINLMGTGGFIGAARANAEPLLLNRTGSDGAILNFRKDGTTVGSIGVIASDILYLATPDGTGVGLNFDGDSPKINPSNGTGAGTDGVADLGNSSGRFKDLYLSGGVYLGGTGAANHLDDYEEGTWTPRIEGYAGSDVGTTQTYSFQSGYYTKIGNMVYATFGVRLSSKGDIGGSYTIIRGFPFGHAGSYGGSFIMNYYWSMGTTVSFIGGELGGGASTSCWVTTVNSTGSTGTSYLSTSDIGNSTGFQGTLVYRVS